MVEERQREKLKVGLKFKMKRRKVGRTTDAEQILEGIHEYIPGNYK